MSDRHAVDAAEAAVRDEHEDKVQRPDRSEGSRKEVRSTLAMPAGGSRVLDLQLDSIFAEYDLDDDGLLQFSEFDAFWSNITGIGLSSRNEGHQKNGDEPKREPGVPSHLVWDARLGRRRPPLGLGE